MPTYPYLAPRKVATTVTSSATLAKGRHTPVDAITSALTLTLPADAAAGVELSVEKVDASGNAVTVSGTLRGVASSTIALTTQYEARTFLSEGSGSWRPTSDHRTATALSATFAGLSNQAAIGQATNLIPDPLTVSVDQWSFPSWGTAAAGSIGAAERVGYQGTPALFLRWSTAPTDSGTNTGPNVNPAYTNGAPVTDGQVVTASMWLEAVDTPGDVQVQAFIWFLNASTGALVQQTGGQVFTIRRGLGPQRITAPTVTTPSGTTVVAVPMARLWTANQVGTGKLLISAPQVEPAVTGGPFRHGDMPGATWSGTRRASSSVALRGPADRIAAYGDSHIGQATGGGFTQAQYLTEMLGRECWDGGRGGETSTGVAIRAGALPVTVSFPGDSMAAATTPVTVTVTVPGTPAPVFRTGSTWSFVGAIAGIDGTLTLGTDGTTWTWSRLNAGSGATATTPNAAFTAYQVATQADLWLIQAYVNNISVQPNQASVNRALYDTAAMVAKCQAEGREYVVLSAYNDKDGASGTSAYTLIMAINAGLAATYGQRFLDVRRWLIDKGLAAAGLTPTTADTTAVAADQIPPQLLADGIHLTPFARRVLAAYLAQLLRARNLLKPLQAIPAQPVAVVGSRTVVPPASLAGLVAPAAWFVSNYSIGHAFTLNEPTTLRYANFRVGAASGNIQVGVVRRYGAGLIFYTRVMNSGVIACPTAGLVRLDLGATPLEPGEYGVFMWADNTAVTLSHAFPTGKGLLDGKLALDFGTQAGGVPLTGNLGGSNGGYTERYISGLTLTDY